MCTIPTLLIRQMKILSDFKMWVKIYLIILIQKLALKIYNNDVVLTKLFKGPIVKHLKEEDRLAATVYLINNDSALVPRGAWMKTIEGKITENSSFLGLEPNDSKQLKSYLHARPPQNKWNTNLLTRKEYNYSFDFLDTIEEDIPAGNQIQNPNSVNTM